MVLGNRESEFTYRIVLRCSHFFPWRSGLEALRRGTSKPDYRSGLIANLNNTFPLVRLAKISAASMITIMFSPHFSRTPLFLMSFLTLAFNAWTQLSPEIIQQPQSQSAVPGSMVIFNVSASGPRPSLFNGGPTASQFLTKPTLHLPSRVLQQMTLLTTPFALPTIMDLSRASLLP